MTGAHFFPANATSLVPAAPQGAAASFSKTNTAKLEELLFFLHFAGKSPSQFSSLICSPDSRACRLTVLGLHGKVLVAGGLQGWLL